MIKRILVPLFIFICSYCNAETIKTDVLVIGGGPCGVAAAIQSARSKVKTLLVETGPWLGGSMTKGSGMCVLDANLNLPSGIWGEFRHKVTEYYSKRPGYDTAYNTILRFEPGVGADILKKMTDTIKNLTVILKSSWTSIKKDGTGWEVEILQNGEKVNIKAKVVVDGTETGEVAKKAGVKFMDEENKGAIRGEVRMVVDDITKPYDRESKLYRTSIGVGGVKNAPAFFIPLGVIVPKDADNLLVSEKALSVTQDVNALVVNPAVQMTMGQGVGATAAFCAFFKTTTKHLNVRIIQGEILDYKGYIMPFTDIAQKDPHFRAIQQVCATGLLKGVQKQNGNEIGMHFEPNDTVRTAEIKPVMNEIYTRFFLWFNKEKPGEKFTLGNLLSLISDYTLTDPENLKTIVSKAWKPIFKLPGEMDLKRPATRLEFAVLANKYLNPFGKTVDLSGKVVN